MDPRVGYLAWSALVRAFARLYRRWGPLDADPYEDGVSERIAELRLRQYY